MSSSPVASPSSPRSGSPCVPLSKNQQKKLRRLHRLKESRAEKRKREKEAKKERNKNNRPQSSSVVPRESKRDRQKRERERLRAALTSGPALAFDLRYEKLMAEKELVHLASQIRWGENLQICSYWSRLILS